MKTCINLLAAILLLPLFTGCEEKKDLTQKEELEKMIGETATYLSDVLIDENGISKCDYNMTEGKWYPYEPAWHTGQAIYGLVEAYKITGNKAFLKKAKKAGDWWVSLEINDNPKLNGMVRAIHGDHAGTVIVFATVSDGTAGLYKLYESTGEEKYAKVPTAAGEWMLENMCLLDQGVCYDNVDPLTGEVMKENSPFWPDKKNQVLYRCGPSK